MNYPFWDAPLGYGILTAGIAVLHVFISHFAIGGGFFLVVSERAARRSGDSGRLEFLERLSRFFALATLVSGALTGVGIWFVIGLTNPAAVAVLIHNFIWIWAIEWAVFIAEITAAILYFYGWRRMTPAGHMTIGWIYFVFAWLSLFFINGILTFMLTPGAWLATGRLWDGFFNPTFWPSLVIRTCICGMLAGLYALLVAAFCKPAPVKARMARLSSRWGLLGLAATLPALYWYWRAIPAAVTTAALQGLPTPMQALRYSYWFAGCIAALLLVFGLILARRLHAIVAALIMAAGLGWFGSFEWFRESIRKPYVIAGYMYGNGVEVADAAIYQKDGYLPHILYRSEDDLADLFRHACRSCHTMQGYKALKPAFEGTDRAFIAAIIRGAHLLRGNMPPFYGTAAEADYIAAYIDHRLDQRSLATLSGLQGVSLGKKVFEIRCGKCHPMGGRSDKTKTLAGLTGEDYRNILDNAATLGAGMPAFTASETDRNALIEYLKTLKAGEEK